jgi:ferredoxin
MKSDTSSHDLPILPIPGKDIGVTFVKPTGERVTVRAPIGDSMLEVAHANGIDIEGACGGETACSTCHVILDKSYFDKLPQARSML